MQPQHYDFTVIAAAEKNTPSLMNQAQSVAEKFQLAFRLFGKCHRLYNSASLLLDQDIQDLNNLQKKKSYHIIIILL